MKIGVIFFSKTDVTGTLVRAAIDAIEKNDIEVFQYAITGADIFEGRFVTAGIFEALEDCNAIIFASPTYMGGVAAQFKAFADASSEVWSCQTWAGKIAAGITSGSAMNGDQSSTLQYLVTLASQHGMVWVGLDGSHSYPNFRFDRLGCQLGVVAHSADGSIHEEDLATARHLANRVVGLVKRVDVASWQGDIS